ncbi:MAG: GNAT family N-acetyltransferase [Verrucomicrobiales bacterium]
MQSLLETNADKRSSVEVIVLEHHAEEGGDLLGIYPLYRKGHRLLSLAENYLDYQDIIAQDAEASRELLSSAVPYAIRENLVFIIGHVSESSLISDVIRKSLPFQNAWLCKRYFGFCVVAGFDIESSAEDGFITALPRRQRRRYRSSAKRMNGDSASYKVEHLWSPDVTPSHIDAIGTLHRENQQLRSGGSPFSDPYFTRFLELQTKTQNNFLLSILKRDDELIAFCMGWGTQETFYYYITDYDRKHASLAPGGWLLIETCKHLVQEAGCNSFRLDLLLGSEAYKTQWETDRYYVDRIVIIPKSILRAPWALAYALLYKLKAIKNRFFRIGYFAESS